MLGLYIFFLIGLDSYVVSIANGVSKKIGGLIRSIRFFTLRLPFLSMTLPYTVLVR